MKKLRIKAIVSILLMLSFMLLTITGAMLYYGKTGVILGVSRQALRTAHFWSAAAMLALVAAHIVLNSRLLAAEFRALFSGKR